MSQSGTPDPGIPLQQSPTASPSSGTEGSGLAGTAAGEGTGGTRDVARQGAAEVRDETTAKAADVRDTAAGEARSVAADARDQATQVVGTAQQQLRSQASEQADRLAQTLKDVSRQLTQMVERSDEPDAGVVRLLRGAADQAGQTAGRLDDGGLDRLVADVSSFARRRPGVFLLGGLAAGVAAGRLLRNVDTSELTQAAKEGAQPDDTSSTGGSTPTPTSGTVSAAGGTAGNPATEPGSGGPR